MRRRKTITSCLCLAAVFTGSCLPANTEAGDFLKSIFKGPGVTQKEPCVERLAQEIDWLERHIDQYGSVVAKQPDIWGQARLTKHREEYEKIMAKELEHFNLYINGSVSRSDQAYLANSFALSAAASGGVASRPNLLEGRTVINPGPGDITTVNALVPGISSQTMSVEADGKVTTSGDAKNPGQIFSSAPIHVGGSHFAGFANSGGIALEPTLALDQRSRYLQHLHELRRINEGDDTADSPGYALNLVRIPISLLPGKLSQKGYGAEVTITATPYLSENLLPTTFRSLVLNDLVQILGLPITRLSDSLGKTKQAEQEKSTAEKDLALLEEEAKKTQAEHDEIVKQINAIDAGVNSLVVAETNKQDGSQSLKTQVLNLNKTRSMHQTAMALNSDQAMVLNQQSKELEKKIRRQYIQEHAAEKVADPNLAKILIESKVEPVVANLEMVRNDKNADREALDKRLKVIDAALEKNVSARKTLAERIEGLKRQAEDETRAAHGSSPRGRRSSDALPPTQISPVFGSAELLTVAKYFTNSYYGPHVRWNGTQLDPVHLPDVQRFLQSELDAAYDVFARLPAEFLVNIITNGRLAERVRKGDLTGVDGLRRQFLVALDKPLLAGEGIVGISSVDQLNDNTELLQIAPPPAHPPAEEVLTVQNDDCVKALVWTIVVEAALLNDRLVHDISDAATNKGCPCQGPEQHAFYLYHAAPEACAAFNEYVRCRWPIHVFALDPVTQDQNIADAFSRRRELQLAVALAFTSGRINAANMTRFVRRLESDFETVSLNRTVVGFSHGDDTFGWQFFPRFQTPPPTTGTFRVLGETLFGGPSPDCELVQRKIEPGSRECTAVVIMPSFVPYLTFDIRTNWFRLNHKHHKFHPLQHATEQSMTDIMKLSRSIKTMHATAAQVCDSELYRDGEVQRLVRRVDQLEKELPLQSMQVQVPIENTLGGFEMFNNGITDLAPDLDGWYGGPGVRPGQPTTLFLVGDHFSVHHTLVVAGDRPIHPNDRMLLSRQIMQVTIPPGVAVSTIDGNEFVDVHVATPYGVTAHLHIPVDKPADVPGSSNPTLPAGWQPSEFFALCTSKTTPVDATETTPATTETTFAFDHFELTNPQGFSVVLPDRTSGTVSLQFSIVGADNRFVKSFQVDNVTQDGKTGAFKVEGAVLADFLGKVQPELTPEVLKTQFGSRREAELVLHTGILANGAVTPVAAPVQLHLRLFP